MTISYPNLNLALHGQIATSTLDADTLAAYNVIASGAILPDPDSAVVNIEANPDWLAVHEFQLQLQSALRAAGAPPDSDFAQQYLAHLQADYAADQADQAEGGVEAL